MLNTEEIIDAFVGGVDFSDAQTVGCLILPDGFPSDGTTTTANDVTGERSIFEEFEGSAIGNCVAELAAPTCITKCSEVVTLSRRWGAGICVCFFVVMMGEVIESLKSLMCCQVEGDIVFAGAVKILQHMEGGFVVFMGWIGVVGCKKGECR
jgi:hypothetical protein